MVQHHFKHKYVSTEKVLCKHCVASIEDRWYYYLILRTCQSSIKMTTPLSNDQTLPVIVWVRSPRTNMDKNQRQPTVTHLRNSGLKRRSLTAYLFLDWSPTSPSKLRRSPRSFPDISGCSGRGGNQATREGSLQASNEVASRRPHGRQAILIHIDVLSLCNLICHFQLFNHCH